MRMRRKKQRTMLMLQRDARTQTRVILIGITVIYALINFTAESIFRDFCDIGERLVMNVLLNITNQTKKFVFNFYIN